MKKIIALVLASMLAIGICGCAATSNNADKSNKGKGNSVSEVEEEKYPLQGVWIAGDKQYLFNSGGTGIYKNDNTNRTFKFTDNKNTLDIEYSNGEKQTFVYTLSGDTLTIEDETGNNITYNKKQ